MQHYYLTLTTSGTAYNVKALILAINPNFKDVGRKFILQSAKANAGDVYIGGAGVTTSNYGTYLGTPGDKIEVDTDLGGCYAVGDAASQILAVLVT